MELRTIPVGNTAHMPNSRACEDFKEDRYDTGYGHIVMVSWDSDDWPDWFKDIGSWALEKGYDWVWFDRDALVVDGLKTYDW